jgi:hypothetical protein
MSGSQRHNRIPGWVPQQLPRQAGSGARVGVHLHPDLAQSVPGPLPDPRRIRPGEDPAEQVHTGLREPLLRRPR